MKNQLLNLREQKLLNDLKKKYSFDIAFLKQAKEQGDLEVDDEYLNGRHLLHSLLVMELQGKLANSITDFMDEYDKTMSENAMLYIVGSSGISTFSQMCHSLKETDKDLAELLLDEMAYHFGELDEISLKLKENLDKESKAVLKTIFVNKGDKND